MKEIYNEVGYHMPEAFQMPSVENVSGSAKTYFDEVSSKVNAVAEDAKQKQASNFQASMA